MQGAAPWRGLTDALQGLNAPPLQVTAKRVSLAVDAFLRRVKSGETAGYPRFKPLQRFAGWGYKTHGDGWTLIQPEGPHGKRRLSGVGEIRMRGKGRFAGTPETGEVIHKSGTWDLSVIYDVASSMLLGMLVTKAVEAGSRFALANTRKVKPTQRCHGCGALVKKELYAAYAPMRLRLPLWS